MEKNGKATISDVAKHAGVSKATVSNYLNHRYNMMKPDTKEQIAEAIRVLNYVPSISARRLSAKAKSKTICLVIPKNLSSLFNTMYYPMVFEVIGNAAEEYGYSTLMYVHSPDDAGASINYLIGIAQTFVDGFIIFDLTPETRYFKEFEKNEIPYICLGEIMGYEDYHHVATDHAQGIRLAMEHLFDLGHKRIAVALEDNGTVVEETRMAEYRKCLTVHGIEFRPELCLLYLENQELDIKVIEDLIHMFSIDDAPTALIISSYLLFYLKKAMREMNLYTPEDLSVVVVEYYEKYSLTYAGFENKDYTRVEAVVPVVAREAFSRLLDLIEGRNEGYVNYLEPVELTVGKTTGPCKNVRS